MLLTLLISQLEGRGEDALGARLSLGLLLFLGSCSYPKLHVVLALHNVPLKIVLASDQLSTKDRLLLLLLGLSRVGV